MSHKSLVVDSDNDDVTLSDISDDEDECCFPDTLPGPIKRNRDMDDLMWALCCRECLMAIDGDGYCACTHEESAKENMPPPKKRTLTGIIDVTGDEPKVLKWFSNKKK